MTFVLDLVQYFFTVYLLSSSSKALANPANHDFMKHNGQENSQASPHISSSDKLLTGCNLPEAITLLMCSSSNNEESLSSAVHSATKLVISQLGHELSLGSISNPQAVEKVSNAIQGLSTLLKDDQSFSSISNSPILSPTNSEQIIASMTNLINNHDKSEKFQREAVQTVSSMPSQSHETTKSNPVLDTAPVLERPPLASAVDSAATNENGQPQLHQVGDLGPSPNQQSSRQIRDTSSTLDSQSQECANANLVSNSCSPMDVQNVLRAMSLTFASAITNVQNARTALLNNVLNAPACSAPGVTGNQLGWASLGTSERNLINIMSTLLKAEKVATEKLKHDESIKTTGNKNTNDVSSFTNTINEVLPEASGLLLSSMDQLSSAAKSMNKDSMNGLMKPFKDSQNTVSGFFGSIFGG